MIPPTRERTIERLESIQSRFSGRFGLAARNLTTGEEFLLDHDQVFPTASSIKTAILYEVFRQAEEGTFGLDDRVELKSSDIVRGSGVLRDIAPGLQPTVHDLAMLMIIVSDNTATNMLIDLVGGPDPVNASMAAIGLDQHDPLPQDQLRSEGDRSAMAGGVESVRSDAAGGADR